MMAVNVMLLVLTVPSATLLDETGMVTVAVGCVLSRTENVADPPASVVASPFDGLTVMPGLSLSTLVTAISGAFRLLYLGSKATAGAVMMV